MDTEKLKVYENKYFKLNQRMMDLVGLWPYSLTRSTLIKQIFVITILSVFSVPHIFAIKKWCGGSDLDRALCAENLTGFMFFLGLLMKYCVTLFHQKKMEDVYEFVSTTWLSIKDSEEKKIMEHFAKQGKTWVTAYFVYVTLATIGFSQIPLVAPTLLDFIVPLNESRKKMLITTAEYGFDPYEHYYKLYSGYCLGFVVVPSVAIAIDTTYTVVVHQCIGTFKIVGHRVRQSTYQLNEDDSCAIMISAIKLHISALQFLKVIESAYNVCLLVLLGLTIIGISIGTLALVEAIHEPLIATRFIIFAIAMYLHLLYITMPGQKVIDSTSALFRDLYDNEWYNMSKKPKIMLKVMMMRCAKPSVLTAGGMYVMNLENMGHMVKTGMSYFTITLSLT